MRIFSKRRVGITALGVFTGLAFSAIAYATPAFGPSRPTFTWANPATYITFNSITDSPVWGDERYVVKARDVNAGTNTYSNNVAVTDNQELLVTTHFHNNAASSLNLVAKNTKVKVALPQTEATNQSLTSYISADNANPTQVWATMDMTSTYPFTLEYISGSAQLKTNYITTALSDNVVKDGVLVGTYHPNGEVKGCSEFSGYVSFRVKVHKKEAPKPVYSCDALNVDVLNNRQISASVAFTAKDGATFSSVDYDFGDGTAALHTNSTAAVNHTYAKDGTYTITSTVNFKINVDGQVKDVSSKCVKKVTITTPQVLPVTTTPLPNTGAGSVLGLFAGVSALGTAGHLVFRRYRN